MQEHGTPANSSSDSKSETAPKKRVYQSQLPWSTARWATQALAASDPKNCHKLRQQQALELLAAGFAIFPLPFGKKVNLTGTWHKHMVVEEGTLVHYWPAEGRGPKSLPWNIGISCKHSWPWKVVFDLDVKGAAGSEAGVEHALRGFMEAAGDAFALYGTRVHKTPRGGYHVIYNSPAIGQHPDGRQILQAYSNSSAAIKARNIDVRGSAGDHGGYIVAPGSYFDGMDEHGVQGAGEGFYEVWHDQPVAEVPPSLAEHLVHYVTGASGLSGGEATDLHGNLLNGHSDGYTRARQWMAFHAPICKPGTGGGADATLMLVARELVNDYGLTPYLALELMTSEIILTDAAGDKRTVKAWNDRCVYGAGHEHMEDTSFPWPIETLERKLDNALNDAARGRLQNARGSKLEALEFKFLQGLDDVVTAYEALKKEQAELAERVKHATHSVKGEEPKVEEGKNRPLTPIERSIITAPSGALINVGTGRAAKLPGVVPLWPGYIQKRHFTLVTGARRSGKSQFLLYMAAIVSTGGAWPNGGGQAKQGHVYIMSAEDDFDTAITPRLIALGANFDFIHRIDVEANENGEIAWIDISRDLPAIAHAFMRCGWPELILIDPVGSYAGKANTNNDSDVRRVIEPLNRWAAKHNCAIVGLRHPKKGADSSGNRTSGSGAWEDVPRNLFEIQIDETDLAEKVWDKRRYLFNTNPSYGPPAPTLAYNIRAARVETTTKGSASDVRETSLIEFVDGTFEITADENYQRARERIEEVVAPRASGVTRDKCCNWIIETLGESERYGSELLDMAKLRSFSEKTFTRARSECRDRGFIVKFKAGYGGDKDEDGRWKWKLATLGQAELATLRAITTP